MTRYKQYATTAYNGVDFSILNVSPTSPPHAEPLNVTTYLATWSKLFQPSPGSQSQNDLAVTNALTYAVTWLLRLYDDVFPDDAHTPLSHLRNFLAIPQQFMVTCLQFANYSVTPEMVRQMGLEGRFALPDDMQTYAVRGRSTTRFLALGWVVWVYIASAGIAVIGVGGVILGMLLRREGVPGSSGFVEVDLAARFQDRDGLRVMRELGRTKELSTAVVSSFGVARELRRRRVRVVPVSASSHCPDLFAFRKGSLESRRTVVQPHPDTEETTWKSSRSPC
jgi:hypothetical protein